MLSKRYSKTSQTPTELKTISQTKGFLKNIRRYNDLFAFSRNFTKYDMFLLNRHEVLDRYTLKMRGKVSHSTPPTLYPISQNVNKPMFSQIYIYSNDEQKKIRETYYKDVHQSYMNMTFTLLKKYSKFLKHYPTITESLGEQSFQFNFNDPSTREPVGNQLAQQKLKSKVITTFNPVYEALHYVLLFPEGNEGFKFKMLRHNPTGKSLRSPYISIYDYTSYRFQRRKGDFEHLHYSGKLGHEYIIDMFFRWEKRQTSIGKKLRKIYIQVYNLTIIQF